MDKNESFTFSEIVDMLDGSGWGTRGADKNDPGGILRDFIMNSINWLNLADDEGSHGNEDDAYERLVATWRVDSYEEYARAIDQMSAGGDIPVHVCCAYKGADTEDYDHDRSTARQIEDFMCDVAQIMDETKERVVFVDAIDGNMLEAVGRYQKEGRYKDVYDVFWDESGTNDPIALFESGDITFKENVLADDPHYLFYTGKRPLGTRARENASLTIEERANKGVLWDMEKAAAYSLTWFPMERDEVNGTTYDVMLVAELVRALTGGKYCAVGGDYENYVGELQRVDSFLLIASCTKGTDFRFVYEDEQLGRDFDRCCKFVKDMKTASEVWQGAMKDMNIVFVLRDDPFVEIDWALDKDNDEGGEEKARALCAKSFRDVQEFADATGITAMVRAVMDGVPMDDVMA